MAVPFTPEFQLFKSIVGGLMRFTVGDIDYKALRERSDIAMIKYAMIKNDFNASRSASAIGMNRGTFYSQCKKYGIEIGDNQ